MSKEGIIPIYRTDGSAFEDDLNEIMKFIKWDVDKNAIGKDFDVQISIEYMAVGSYIICNQDNMSKEQVLDLCKKHDFDLAELKPHYIY